VDVYTSFKKIKHPEKCKNTTTERKLNIKMSTRGGPVSTFSLPPLSVTPLRNGMAVAIVRGKTLGGTILRLLNQQKLATKSKRKLALTGVCIF